MAIANYMKKTFMLGNFQDPPNGNNDKSYLQGEVV